MYSTKGNTVFKNNKRMRSFDNADDAENFAKAMDAIYGEEDEETFENKRYKTNEEFTNKGYDEDGNLLGNCTICDAKGVSINTHNCEKKKISENKGFSMITSINEWKKKNIKHTQNK